ncbi:hypothetical protein ACHAWO_006374 [Cyclotella atomus]|uniref:NADH dehydrogenase [ubiquinone] 1 alpha subcomplex assembly factor 3 n=1 Tax=Cyclotella atomus TaxID=382360 RepID=A0ABD3P7Y0_9STRA
MQRLQRLSYVGRGASSRLPATVGCMPMATSHAPQLPPLNHNELRPKLFHNSNQPWPSTKRCLSSITKGQDLLEDSLTHRTRRKIILDSYGPSGFDVKGMIRVGDVPINDEVTGEDVIIHMNGSIAVFPNACFLWNVKSPKDVTLESLSVVKLYKPTVEYLFIGCDSPMPTMELNKIKREFGRGDNHVIVEQMDVMNAMGTFNILNGEDRRVACVLVLDPEQ